MELVSYWLETLPMHWAFEVGVTVKKPDLSVDVSTSDSHSDAKAQVGPISDKRLIRGANKGHEKIKANLEQKMKLVDFELSYHKRKRVSEEETEEIGEHGGRIDAMESVEVEEAKKEIVMVRPVKRARRACKNVVVVATR